MTGLIYKWQRKLGEDVAEASELIQPGFTEALVVDEDNVPEHCPAIVVYLTTITRRDLSSDFSMFLISPARI